MNEPVSLHCTRQRHLIKGVCELGLEIKALMGVPPHPHLTALATPRTTSPLGCRSQTEATPEPACSEET